MCYDALSGSARKKKLAKGLVSQCRFSKLKSQRKSISKSTEAHVIHVALVQLYTATFHILIGINLCVANPILRTYVANGGGVKKTPAKSQLLNKIET